MNQLLQPVLRQAADDADVLAVMVFGSHSRGDARADSDLDVCLVLEPKRRSREELAAIRERYLPLLTAKRDISLFQQLPLYVRHRVLKEGEIALCKNEMTLYEVAYRTAQEFDAYKPYYRRYLEQVARAGP